jgi:LacI family transcriptional regulator
MSQRSNIRDVSALAGVSVKTVSRVLNDHPYVSAATRAKVDAAMKQLDFKPSVAARILAGTKSGQIALIYDNHSAYYINQIQAGCWHRCREESVRLLGQPVDVSDPGIAEQIRWLVTETHVDGIILSPPVSDCDPVLRLLEQMDIPFVRISPGTNHAVSSSVFMDDAQAADDMTLYLIHQGHQRIGFIKGDANHMASDDRLLGYRRAMARAGLPIDPMLIAEGMFDFDSGFAAGEQFLALADPPTAIFASNDDMATGVQAAARKAGLDIPGDLSVVGYDDIALARMVWPPLTTIRQPIFELASAATDLLLTGANLVHRRLPHALIERQSVAAPKRIFNKEEI